MNKFVKNCLCLSTLGCACCCLGAAVIEQETEAVVYKMSMLANESRLVEKSIDAEVHVFPRQPVSNGELEFSIALLNNSKEIIAFRANAFLDAMIVSLVCKDDLSLTLPKNARFRIHAPILPPRPYVISGWRTVTEVSDETTITNVLASTILHSNDSEELRNAKVEIPAMSMLIVDFKITTLVKSSQGLQSPVIEKVAISEGVYDLGLSLLLILDEINSTKNHMRFRIENPISITIHRDEESHK